MDSIPTVDSFCFGLIPLKTGTIIAGVISLLVELGVHGYAYQHGSGDLLATIFGILVICGIISSILLIVGVLIANKLLVKFYVIIFLLLVIFSIIVCILALLNKNYANDKVYYIINTLIYVCIIFYCAVVANSYQLSMG